MSQACGIDYGTKRIGLAIGDPVGGVASPLTTIAVRGQVADQVRAVVAAVADFDVAEWVVGLPLNMDDTEGPQAKVTRGFGEALARTSGKPVHYWDERLSSVTADEYLAEAELTRKQRKARRDRVAAQVILQMYLDARTRGGD
ncbi:MAG: Holliday junction resolvase RuvX [bacterium]|nr:Holliday junction resolvase RuvX [bacterium]